MQSEGKIAAGAAKKYPSAFGAYGIIARYATSDSHVGYMFWLTEEKA